jgi:hypothetical protein
LAIIKALNSKFFLSKNNRNISYIIFINYKKIAFFSKKILENINYFLIYNNFDLKNIKELSEYLVKKAGEKYLSIICLIR